MIVKKGISSIVILVFIFVIIPDVFAQPVVVTQPQDTSVCVESSAGFSIIAVNTSTYQWQEFDGVGWYNITESVTYAQGEDSPDLTIVDANLALNGSQYRCIVSDLSAARDTSHPATLGVYEPPFITADPENERVCKNEIAYFSAEAVNGTVYQWQEFNGTGWLNLVDDAFYSGTDSPDLSIYTVLGMNGLSYRCVIRNVSCPDTTLSATLVVDPTPIIYTITGGGEYCEGDDGLVVGLDGSQSGISYNLIRDDIQTGQVLNGTGSALSFGLQIDEGVYTITGYNQFTSCISDMAGYAQIIRNPLPQQYEVIGGGDVCDGDVMPDVMISGSESGVEYSLYCNSMATGQVMSGTGYEISFGMQQQAGVYTVAASNIETGCTVDMSGEVEIRIIERPVADAGDDQIIPAGSSALMYGAASNGSGAYDFFWFPEYLLENPMEQNTSTYDLEQTEMFRLYVSDLNTGCVSLEDTVIVYIKDTTFSVIVNGSPNPVCYGSAVTLSAIPTGGSGFYTYSWTSVPEGFYSGEQFPVVYPESNTLYIVSVSDGNEVITDTVKVVVVPVPIIYSVQGGGQFCSGEQGVNISLDGSQTGVDYYLINSDNETVAIVAGTGSDVDFGIISTGGDYSVLAVNQEGGCSQQMDGSVTVVENQLPIADAGSDIYTDVGSNVTLHGSASGSPGDVDYLWSPPDMLINPNDADATTIPLHTTTMFSLQVTDNQTSCVGESDNMIVFVTGGDLGVEIVYSKSVICPGEFISIYAMPSGGDGNYSYSWRSEPEGIVSSDQFIYVSPSVTTKYIVTVADGDYVAIDTAIIELRSAPQKFALTGGGGYCVGGTGKEILLDDSEPSVIYSLYRNAQATGYFTSGTGAEINFGSFLTEGYYSVAGINNDGCVSMMDSVVNVEAYPLPEKFTLLGGGTYCENDPRLGILLESSQPGVQYELLKDAESTGFVKQGTGMPLSFDGFDGTGYYSVIAGYEATGCSNTMDGVASLLLFDEPDIVITGPGELCKGDTISLTASGAMNYQWNTEPAVTTPSINVSPESTDVFMVTGYNSHNCVSVSQHEVVVNDPPVISLYNDDFSDMIVCDPDNLYDYTFEIDGNVLQEGSSGSWYYGNAGVLSDSVTVTGTDYNGCKDTKSEFVSTGNSPNAFTPDGDGVNDVFMKGYEIMVFSSWGSEIYNGSDGWDGKYNGKLVTPGTYYYVHHVYGQDGSLINTIKGSVTVVIN